MLRTLVHRFYAKIHADAELGPIFARIVDWEPHLERMVAFWYSVALMTGRVLQAFDAAQDLADRIDGPIAQALSTAQGRLRVETLQQAVGRVRETVAAEIGEEIGVTAGFNAMDGD